MERSPFHVHSLNHDHHRHKKSINSANGDDDSDLKRRCSCLNHRHRYRPPTPERPKRPEGTYLSRMKFSRDPFGQGYTDYGQTWPHGERPGSATPPPSTPGSARRRQSTYKYPSTTPAGRPPSNLTNRSDTGRTSRTSRSTTPSGPPPPRSSAFGSSQNYGSPTAARSHTRPFGSPSQRGRSMSTYAGARGRGSGIPVFNRSQSAGGFYVPNENRSQSASSFYVSGSSPPPPFIEGEDEDLDRYYEDEHDPDCHFHHDNLPQHEENGHLPYQAPEEDRMEEDNDVIGEEEEDEVMEDGFGGKPQSRKSSRPASPSKSVSVRGEPVARSRASTLGGSPIRSPAKSRLGVHHHTYDIGGIAKSMAKVARPANILREPDHLVLQTERILNALGESDATEEVLAAAVKELGDLWNHPHRPVPDVVGPAEDDSPLAKADFITSLLLQLHHPPPFAAEKNALALSTRGQRSAFSTSFARPSAAGRDVAMPKVLLDWLAAHHDPSAAEFEQFRRMAGDYSSRPGYWDVVFACVMRGGFSDALTFLKGGNFAVAETALEDGYSTPGYTGTQLENVNSAVLQAIELLEACPAYYNDDWDVKGSDWMLWRRTVATTIEDLREFAEGERQREEYGMSTYEDGYNFSTASRRAESRVPWAVYENLQILYDLLLGKPEEILQTSFDWLEAAICMTAWWDGEDEEESSLALARRGQRARASDVTPKQAYRKRLTASIGRILAEDDPGLTINSNNPVEIALACVMEENMEGVISILRGWSMTMTTAVVEVASAGGWLGDSVSSRNLTKGFDKSDLMVLSFGQGSKKGINKDELLQQYAELLFDKTQIESSEGWELAIQVLGRLDHAEAAKDKIGELLDRLPLSSAERVDKILDVCNSLGLNDHANTIAERYAASLAENSYNYGSALFYYARAHNSKKIRDVLDLLISLCLVHSTAYPPQADLDDRLKSLINTPKQTLSQLSRTDLEAAQMLSMYLSGYATLRKFYDLRDEEFNAQEGKKAVHRPMERKRKAAQALIAVINSAADSIRGGLYDPQVDAVVQVDGLLTLLGEALPFINQPTPLLSLAELSTLLQAVEDFQTAPSLVAAQCEEHLQAALAHGNGTAPSSPPRSALLKKSISNLTASSYSLVGGSSTEGSGVLVEGAGSGVLSKEAKRGWDWRKGIRGGVKGADVCRVLRLGVAKEMGRAWAEGEDDF